MRERLTGASHRLFRQSAWLLVACALLPAATHATDPSVEVSQSELLDFLARGDSFVLIDARTPAEFDESHIDGAVNVPQERVAEYSDVLPGDLAAPIVVYCRTGKRARLLRTQLAHLGYQNVRTLLPAQISWSDRFAAFNCAADVASAPFPVPKRVTTEGETP